MCARRLGLSLGHFPFYMDGPDHEWSAYWFTSKLVRTTCFVSVQTKRTSWSREMYLATLQSTSLKTSIIDAFPKELKINHGLYIFFFFEEKLRTTISQHEYWTVKWILVLWILKKKNLLFSWEIMDSETNFWEMQLILLLFIIKCSTLVA